MAIQIQYPFINAISLSLSTSRGSPARLYAVGGPGNGVPFDGSLIGTGAELAVGRNFTISEYIDSSIYLDQNNIILFRRGMPSKIIKKQKDVVVPVVRISGNARSAKVLFYDKKIKITVERLKGTDTLGEEDWSDSPCSGSQTRYLADDALNIIGAPGAGDYWCSYEGQYRSVLSSIYSDIGCTYWWNFATGGLGKICTSSGGNNGLAQGCNIISSVSGTTKEGTRTHSSFTYEREQIEEIRSISFSKTFKSSFSVSPYKGVIYPSFSEIRKSLWDGISTYDNLSAGYAPPEYIDYGTISLPGFYSADMVKVFQSKFNWNLSKSNNENWSRILGLPDLRTDSWGNVSDADDISAGILKLVRSAPPRSYRRTLLELFYPYNELTVQYPTSVSRNTYSLKVKNTTLTVSPNPSARGYNTQCGSSPEDLLSDGINNPMGLWRGVQIYSPDDAEEGITDFSNAGLSLQLQESIADCVYQVNTEPFLFYETIGMSQASKRGSIGAEEYEAYMAGDKAGTLRYMFKRGYAIIWIRPPRKSVNITSSGEETNCNDLSEVVGYTDPNIVVTQSAPKETSSGDDSLSSVCDSAVQSWIEDYGVSGEEDEGANVEILTGLLHANGEAFTLSAGGESKKYIMPSFAKYNIARALSTQYEFQVKIDAGNIGKGNWVSKGNTGGDGINHTVSVTDVTDDGDGDFKSVPNSSTSSSSIGYSKYTATDFCCPIDGLLESLNANIGPDGVTVSYSYRGLSPMPGVSQTKTTTKGISRGFVQV